MLGLIAALVLGSGTSVALADALDAAERHIAEGDLAAAVIELKNALQQNPRNQQARFVLGKLHLDLGDGEAAHKELFMAQDLGRPGLEPLIARSLLIQRAYRRLLESFPVDRDKSADEQALMHALRGDAEAGLGQRKAAAASYAAALALDPAQPDALLGQARLALQSGEADAAQRQVQQVLNASPELPDAWALLARIALQRQDNDGAEAAFDKAIELAPVDFRYRIERALARIEREDYDAALEDIERLRMEHAGQPAVAYLAGRLAFHTGRFDVAYEEFMQAQGVPAFKRELPFYLGASALATGNPEQALDALGAFLGMQPDSVSGARLLARARLATGDKGGAEQLLEQVLQSSPEDADALRLMARIREADGDMAAAADYRRRLSAAEPSDRFAQSALGLALIQGDAESVEEGIQVLEQSLAQAPNQLPADIGIVAAHLRQGRHQDALSAALAMADKYPDNGAPFALAGIAEGALGNLDGARVHFEQALKLTPGEPSTAGNLAAIALSQGRLDEARGYYQQALERHPDHLDTLLKLANLEARFGDEDAALGLLHQAARAHPNALAPLLALTGFHQARQAHGEALVALRPVQDTFSQEPQYWAVLGMLQLSTGDPAAAVASLNRRVELEPESAGAHLQLANAQAAAGDAAGFERSLMDALELDPKRREAGALIDYYFDQAAPDDARQQRLERIESVAPERPEPLARRAVGAMRERRFEAAEAYYRQGMERFPERSPFVIGLAKAQLAQDDIDAAAETLTKRLDDTPDDVLAMSMLAELQIAQGRGEEGLATLTKAAELAPENARVLNNLAWLLRKDDTDMALEHARRAVTLSDRRQPSFLDTLGLILLEAGDAESAKSTLLEAVALEPTNPTVNYHYARALEQTGSPGEARRVLLELLSSERSFPERAAAEALAERLR
jgi:putative PEP-CTERM system TPR-repeat lipoprotein